MKYNSSMNRILFVVLLLFVSVGGNAETVSFDNDGVRRPLRLISEGEIDYLSCSDFFVALGGSVSWTSPDNRVAVQAGAHELSFRWGNPYCTVDDTLRNLVYTPIYYVDDLYLPVNQLISVLGDRLGLSLIYDRGRRSLLAVPPSKNVAKVSVDEKLNGILMEILLTQPLRYEIFITEGNWVNVTLIGGKLDPKKLSKEKPSPQVRRVRAFQFDKSAQISVQMRGKIVDFHHNAATYPDRIQVSIEDAGYQASGADSTEIAGTKKNDSVEVIVIDPGHGGDFNGAIGRDGLKEKDVVLDIALKLEELLDRDPRYTAVLTRRQDHTVPLEQRALTANAANGDLFVSIHTNASSRRDAGGCETYFLSPAADDMARVTELLENSDFKVQSPAVGKTQQDDVGFIVMDLLQTEYLHQSKLLAEDIQSSLHKNLNIKSRGINQAGFAVLNRVSMPAVLVETAFISNRVEEKLLDRESFRQSVADAIYQGIARYTSQYQKESSLDARSE